MRREWDELFNQVEVPETEERKAALNEKRNKVVAMLKQKAPEMAAEAAAKREEMEREEQMAAEADRKCLADDRPAAYMVKLLMKKLREMSAPDSIDSA